MSSVDIDIAYFIFVMLLLAVYVVYRLIKGSRKDCHKNNVPMKVINVYICYSERLGWCNLYECEGENMWFISYTNDLLNPVFESINDAQAWKLINDTEKGSFA